MNKRWAVTVFAAASWVVALSSPCPVHAEPILLNMAGNNFSLTEAQSIGQSLEIVGLLSQVQNHPPFPLPGIVDWSTEYTIHISNLVLQDPPGVIENYSGGTIEVWAGAPDAPFAPSTPIADIPGYDPLFDRPAVPFTFANGTLLLQGNFASFTTIYFSGNTGSISSSIQWIGGSKLADLTAQNIQDDWHWNGVYDVNAAAPPGYRRIYGGRVERAEVVSVEPTTWGRVKELWRGE